MQAGGDVGLSGVVVDVVVVILDWVHFRLEIVVEGTHPVWNMLWIDLFGTIA